MYQRIVPNRHIVAYYGFGFLVGAVYAGTVLHIYFGTHPYAVYIAPNHSIKPYAAIIAHHHITHNSGIRGYKTTVGYFWRNALYW
jgi:hypothetical protein